MKAKSKVKPKPVRRDAIERLLRAAGAYVKLRGGSALVAGPIGVTSINDFSKIPQFYLMIKIVGQMPTKPETR